MIRLALLLAALGLLCGCVSDIPEDPWQAYLDGREPEPVR